MEILGIQFYNGSAQEAVRRTRDGGLVLAPSGPGLACDLIRNPAYQAAVQGADLVLADSGAMVMAWNIMHAFFPARQQTRLSGLKYLRALIVDEHFRAPEATLWLMPSESDLLENLEWLRDHGFPHLRREDCFIAPIYRKDEDGGISDVTLARIIEERQPRYVILNIGGGVQEQLGWWLRCHLPADIAIICTGAALAFLSGRQADIPVWADRLNLGWLLRCLSAPGRFIPRYWEAKGMFWTMIRYRSRLPVMKRRIN